MSPFNQQLVIIGSSKATNELNELAYKTGAEIAKQGYILICGGRDGVMEAACKGARENGGQTVGVIPDEVPEGGNKYLDIVIPTGIGFARNFIVQNSGSVIIMIGGSYGTLSELAYALQHNKRIISLASKWEKIDPKIIIADNPIDAVEKAIS